MHPDFIRALIAAGLKMAIAVGYIMLAVPMIVWLERKVIADFQARIGPSRVGPFGLLQSFADGLKLLSKEAITPTEVDRFLYLAAPVMVMIPALAVAAVIPFAGPLDWDGYRYHMIIASVPERLNPAQRGPFDIPVGVLFVLALTSLSVYGIVLSGWSSNNKYSLLGGLRSAAQMVSYELPLGLSLVAGLMIASYAFPGNFFSLSLEQIVESQAGWFWNWGAFNPRFLFLGFLAMITFFIGGLAETNRAPFDLPEAETELVAGFLTEYGGMKWAMFFLGEYAAMLNVASITTTFFLGGWHGPYPDPFAAGSLLGMLHGLFWFGLKVYGIIIVYIWLRATLPRIRYDQLMGFSWKVMLPATLVNVLVIATILTVAFPAKAPAALLGDQAPGAGAPPGTASDPHSLGGLVPPGNTPAGNVPGGLPGMAPGMNAPPGNGPAGNAPAGAAPPANLPAANSPAHAPANAPPGGNAPGGPGPAGPAGNTPGNAPTAPGGH